MVEDSATQMARAGRLAARLTSTEREHSMSMRDSRAAPSRPTRVTRAARRAARAHARDYWVACSRDGNIEPG